MSSPVEAFEKSFSEYTGATYSIAVSNGTAALLAAIDSLALRKGARIITTPYSFPATANAIILSGHKPVFVDVCADCQIDPVEVEKAASSADAVLVVHLFGRPCRVRTIQEKCPDLPIIEDCSQATGLRIGGKHVGTFGMAGTFSFYASKNLSTFEGGMMITDDEDMAILARRFINHGFEGKEMIDLGYNFKMPWINAFIGEQALKLHKPGIEAELGRYGPKDGYYPKLIYQHKWYQNYPSKWESYPCPTAEHIANLVRSHEY